MEESSGGISEMYQQIPEMKTPFKFGSSMIDNSNMYIYILIAVLILCGIIYSMYNKTFNEIGNMFSTKSTNDAQKSDKTYYINDINGNKIQVSGTLISSPNKDLIKPKIIHPQKEIIDMNFDDVQLDEDDKTKIHNLTNSEMNEIHHKLENIEY